MENLKKQDKNDRPKYSVTPEEQQGSVYMRDDHCDWGNSGMNEYTKEFDNIK